MAKSKKNNKAKKSSVNVKDMAPEQNPSGGTLSLNYSKIETDLSSSTLKITDGTSNTLLPAINTTTIYHK